MDERKVTGYRTQAETCLANAERTHDIPTKRFWIQLAAAWTQIADNITKLGPKKNNKT